MNAKEQVSLILADAGIAMTAKHVPTTFDPKSKDWQHIAWRVEFSSPRGKFSTDYKQGIGHLPAGMVPAGGRYTIYELERVQFTLSTGMVPRKDSDLGSNINFGAKPLPKPEAADVVYSLVSDASAADYASFEDWAADMGDDPDSRQAEKTFNLCRQIALDLFRVFGADVVEKLRPVVSEM